MKNCLKYKNWTWFCRINDNFFDSNIYYAYNGSDKIFYFIKNHPDDVQTGCCCKDCLNSLKNKKLYKEIKFPFNFKKNIG